MDDLRHQPENDLGAYKPESFVENPDWGRKPTRLSGFGKWAAIIIACMMALRAIHPLMSVFQHAAPVARLHG